MTRAVLSDTAQTYIRRLCVDIESRPVGSQGNREATAFFAETVASFGFHIETPAFDCIDWTTCGVHLSSGNTIYKALASPYTLGCCVEAPLAAVSTVEVVESRPRPHEILLLHGDIAKEQLMPKNFCFYKPEAHQRINRALETARPLAIIAATSRDTEMAGAARPFPLFEDGDFDIPSVYVTDEEGQRLGQHVGDAVRLEIRARRTPATGYNVIAKKGVPSQPRVVLFAHIDTKMGTPGASDNASGVVVLLLLAQLLAGYSGEMGIEIVAMNGEVCYSSPGERLYLEHNAGRFSDMMLGINIDGVGYHKGDTVYSLYDCPDDIEDVIRTTLAPHRGISPGEQWVQGDHGLFLLEHVPAVAFTSEPMPELGARITHTPMDTPAILDATKLSGLALALYDLLDELCRTSARGPTP